jgi:hypothetical protein
MTQVNVDKAIDFVCTSGDSILSALALSVAGRMDAEQVLDTGVWTTLTERANGPLAH